MVQQLPGDLLDKQPRRNRDSLLLRTSTTASLTQSSRSALDALFVGNRSCHIKRPACAHVP